MKKDLYTKPNHNYSKSLEQNMKPYMNHCPVKRMAFHRVDSRKQ
jgi:hypothetical protein